MSYKNINSYQLYQLPRQIVKCPKEIQEIESFDKKTTLSTDDYLRAEWKKGDMHCMLNVALRIKQIETKTVSLTRGGSKTVTNIMATNDSLFEVHITGWEPYTEFLAELQIGGTYLFSNLYVKDLGSVIYGNTGYALGYRFGSDIRAIIQNSENNSN